MPKWDVTVVYKSCDISVRGYDTLLLVVPLYLGEGPNLYHRKVSLLLVPAGRPRTGTIAMSSSLTFN